MKVYYGPSGGKGKHNWIPTKTTSPGAKDSQDSRYPESSFSKNELSGKACPEFALGNNSTFREIVKGQQLFQVKQTLSVFFYTDSEAQQNRHSSENNWKVQFHLKSLGTGPTVMKKTRTVSSTGYISTHHIQCHTTRCQAGAADKVKHVRARKGKAADDS